MRQSAKVSLMKCEFKTEARRKLIPSEYLKQPQPPGCPILRALCEGWDANPPRNQKALAFVVLCSLLSQPQPPGCPILRALCEGWDANRHATKKLLPLLLSVLF